MKKLMAYELVVFFGYNQMTFAKNSANWQPLKVKGENIFIDTHSIKTVFPPAKLKSQYIGEYKIVKMKLPSKHNDGYLFDEEVFYDIQLDCKNSLMGIYGVEVYDKEKNRSKKEEAPLFDNEMVWDKVKPSGQGDYQLYRYVCQGVVPHSTQ